MADTHPLLVAVEPVSEVASLESASHLAKPAGDPDEEVWSEMVLSATVCVRVDVWCCNA